MRNQCFRLATLMILLLLTRGGTQTPDWLHIHGLIGQGFMMSSANNYFMDTKDGSVEFNEAAINFTVQIGPRLRGGMQFFSRDFGPNGNNEIFLDWGYLDYRWNDYLGFRAGKIKRPSGFYNTIRDIDALRTFVLLPQGVYDESIRDFTMSAQGASVYGNIPLGFAGDLDYEGYYGISNMDPDRSFTKDLFSGIASDIGFGIYMQMLSMGNLPQGAVLNTNVQNASNKMKHSEGLALVWNTPLNGLRLGATRMMGQTRQSATFNYHMLMQNVTITQVTIPFVSKVKFKALDVYSAEFLWNNLSLAGEYLFMDREITSEGKKRPALKQSSYYGQASYRFTSWLEAGTYYSVLYPDADDKEGEHYDDAKYRAWQKDLCFTLRFDLNDRWLMKFETHFMDGTAQLSESLNPGGCDRDWQLYAVKTSIIF